MAGPEYETPLLPLDEILSHASQIGIDLTENDVKRPEPKRWRQTYGHLFEALTDRSIEQATQSLCRNVHLHTEDPELYEEGFAQVAFTMCMQRVLSTCKFEGFSLQDILDPSPKRLQKILSCVINFLNHKYQRNMYFDEEKEKIERAREKYDSVKNRSEELKKRLARMEEMRTSMTAEKKQLNEQIEEGAENMEKLSSQQRNKQKEADEVNLAKAERQKDIETLKQKIQEVNKEKEKLSLKIVQSPERFKLEKEKLNKRVNSLKEELAGKEQTLSENRALLEKTKGKKLAAAKAYKLATEAHKAIEEEQVKESDIQRLTEYHDELLFRETQNFKLEEDVGEKLRHRQDQRRTHLQQVDVKKSGEQQKLQEYKELKDKIQENNEKIMSEVTSLKKASNTCKSETEQISQQVEEAQQELNSEMIEIIKEAKALDEKIVQVYTYCKNKLPED